MLAAGPFRSEGASQRARNCCTAPLMCYPRTPLDWTLSDRRWTTIDERWVTNSDMAKAKKEHDKAKKAAQKKALEEAKEKAKRK